MATLREIKRRIVGVQSTQQITKAMKMVAAARLRRAQENIINARPYSRKISDVLAHLLSLEKEFEHPFLEKREVKRAALVVVTSDRGLCGGFNMNIIRTAEELISNEYAELQSKGNLELYCIGKRGADYFKSKNVTIRESYLNIFSDLKFDFASKINKEFAARFVAGEIDEVVVLYNEFKSVVQQKIVNKKLYPIEPANNTKTDMEIHNGSEYIYEPNKIDIINSLLPRYLNAQVWTSLLDSYAAELGARMTAMDMATENATELIRSLRITYNKERQASITNEILEIVSGANALQKA